MKGKCKDCEYKSDKCKEIAMMHKQDVISPQQTLCWCCKNAVPEKDSKGIYICGCEWSIKSEPVPGWEVSSAGLVFEQGHSYMTYCVSRCPKFERG